MESMKTGEERSFDEACVLLGDILRKQQAAAADREEAWRRAIRERLGIGPEKVDRLSHRH